MPSVVHKQFEVNGNNHDFMAKDRGGSIYRKYRRYIADIDISVSVRIGTLDIGFF